MRTFTNRGFDGLHYGASIDVEFETWTIWFESKPLKPHKYAGA